MVDKLKVLIPSQTYETSIGKVTLAPFKFKQFPAALALVEKYSEIVFGEKLEVIEGESVRVPKSAADIAREVLAKHQYTAADIAREVYVPTDKYLVLADISEMLGLVSDRTLADLDDLGYDEVIGLLVEVVQMNMDFFKRVGSRLSGKGPDTSSKPKSGTSESAD